MITPPEQFQMALTRSSAWIFLATLTSTAALLSGCAATQKRAAIPWTTAVMVRPTVPPRTEPSGEVEDPVPDLRVEIPPPPAPLAASATVPARPRTVAPPVNHSVQAERNEAPVIVPELSEQETASLQRQTEASLGTAERNLAAASGRKLNAVQSDLASKVRSFLSEAKEAEKSGDLLRARELAKKAQVLSEELASSL
jgi:hypothetical protein